MKIYFTKVYFFFCLLVIVFACSSPATEQVSLRKPYFADTIPFPARNPLTPEGVALGEVLFSDASLSKNDQISCATCHLPAFAFADTMSLTDKGLSKKKLVKNTPTLENIAWANQGLFWDGGVQDIESLIFAPLRHADEMGQDLAVLPQKLMQKQVYRAQFKQVFSQDTITNALIARALAQYVRSLHADQSRYDGFIQKKISFNSLENKGLEIFAQYCQSCHRPPFFTDFDFHRIQQSKEVSISDNPLEDFGSGRFRITGDSADIGKFKTPPLRNLKLTFPYLHDGSAKTLKEAILAHEAVKLSPVEVTFLLAFLNTLNK